MKHIFSFLLKIFLLPTRVLSTIGRGVARVLGILLAPLLLRIDSSPVLSNQLNSLSSSMATQRGLLLMVGMGMVIVSLIVHGLTLAIMVSTASFDSTLYWLCIPVTLMHAGVLAGFTGAMLAVPLGQGYKDK